MDTYETYLYEKKEQGPEPRLALVVRKHQGPGDHREDPSFEELTETVCRILPDAGGWDILRLVLNPIAAYVSSFRTEGFIDVLPRNDSNGVPPEGEYILIARSRWSEDTKRSDVSLWMDRMTQAAGTALQVYGKPVQAGPEA